MRNGLHLYALALTLGLAACGRRAEPYEVRATDHTTPNAYVRIPARLITPAFVRQSGFNQDHVRDSLYAFGSLKRSALQQLPAADAADVVELNPHVWAHHAFDPRTLALLDTHQAEAAGAEPYHDYAAMTTELQRIATTYPQLVTLTSAGKSKEGRDLWLLKLTAAGTGAEQRPKLLYISNMHGDETVGRELLIYLARQLTDDYGKDSRVTAMMNSAQVYLMPSMNPDGYEADQRENIDGVDLNRDFPDFHTDPTDTPAGRAPETQAVMALHDQNHFVMALNFHGGSVCFNTPWDSQLNSDVSTRFGDDALMQLAGHTYANLNQTMQANNTDSFDHGVTYGGEWYIVNGGMQDWSDYYRNSIHATLELTYTKWPDASELPTRWTENQEALWQYLEQGLTGAHLQVVDPTGKVLSNVKVRVSSANRDVTYPTGYVHRPTVPGAQTATVSAAGYKPATVSFTPARFDGTTYTSVTLQPQ